MSIGTRFEIQEYVLENGKSPFRVWLASLKDKQTQWRIDARVARVEQGNFGDCKNVGQGVWELRIAFGPGYRVYFGLHNDRIVLLLCGGDKKTQPLDIKRAQRYWQDFLKR